MIVSELMRKLENFDGNAEVVIYCDDYFSGYYRDIDIELSDNRVVIETNCEDMCEM